MGEKDGIQGKFVFCADIDQNGTVFLSNFYELLTYDGISLKHFDEEDGLPNLDIALLQSDRFNRTWVLHQNNRLSYYYKNKIYTIYGFSKIVKNTGSFVGIYPYSKDEFIIDFANPQKSFHFKRKNNRWQLEKVKSIETDKSNSVDFNFLFRDPNNRKKVLWRAYSSTERGHKRIIHLVHLKSKKHYRYSFPDVPGYHRLIITEKSSYYLFRNHFFELTSNGRLRKKILDFEIERSVNGLNGCVWLKKRTGGWYEFDTKTLKVKRALNFSSFTVNNVKQDKFGGLWLLTSNGLGYLPKQRHKTYHRDNYFLSRVNQMCFIGDSMLIGHADGNIGLFIKGQKEKLIYDSPYDEMYNNGMVSNFAIEKSGNILFTNYRNGVYRIHRKTLQVQQISELGAGRMFTDTDGRIFIGQYGRGMSVIENGIIKAFEKEKLKGRNCVNTIKTGKNRYLISTDDQIFILENGKVRRFKTTYKKLNNVSCMRQSNKLLAISTYGNGLFLISDGDTVNLTAASGLTSNIINDIYLDKHQQVRLATANGISVIKKKGKTYEIKTIKGNECLNYENFFFKTYQDQLWVVSDDGLMRINQNVLGLKKDFYPLHIEEIVLNDKKIDDHKRLSFDYTSTSRLTIRSKIIFYDKRESIQYYYRLLGQSNNWYQMDGGELIFTNLRPGKYTLQTYAKIGGYDQRSNSVELEITVKPRFWQYPAFVIGCILALLLMLLFAIMRILKRQRKNHATQLQIAGLQANVIRAQMNPHFMFNAINSIQGYILSNETKLANFYLGKFSSLLRSIIEISKNDFVVLSDELELLRNYIALEKMRCNEKFDFEFLIEDPERTESLKIPAMIIQPFLENAILHGLTPLEGRKGQLTIQFKLVDNILSCEITDNGIGREKSAEINLKKSRYHKSASMSLTEERIHLYNKLHTTQAQISIEDLTDENGQGVGTKVLIYLPILNENEI